MNKVTVSVTGAAGQIGYALLFRIASGQMFGANTRVHLKLLELPRALNALKGVKMELDDCAFPLLDGVTCTDSQAEAFADADWALLVGSVPRKAGMERGDLLKINGGIFTEQGKNIAEHAKSDCKVLVVGNPCNTNAYIAKESAKGKISDRNFYAMTMLDQNRAYAQVAQKANCSLTEIKNLAIWGNHSSTQFPNFEKATIAGAKATAQVADLDWWQNDFMKTVQKRGAAIIEARGASSAASAANAVVDTVRSLTEKTPEGECFSVALCSDGSYGVPEGLIFSYPVKITAEGKREIVQGLELSDFEKQKIKETADELVSEREAVKSLL